MSQEQRRRSARRGSVWRTITAIAGAAAMVTAMAALAPAANAGGNGGGGGGSYGGGGGSYGGGGGGGDHGGDHGDRGGDHGGGGGDHGGGGGDHGYTPKYKVTVDKDWVNATSGDQATIKINGSGSDNNAKANKDGNSTNSGVVSQPSLKENASVTITEDESQGNERDYTSTLACYTDENHSTQWSTVNLGASFYMPKSDLYCVITNTGSIYPYDVTFVWQLKPGANESSPFDPGPQTYVTHAPGSGTPTYVKQCDTIYQIDSYRVKNDNDQTTVNGFIGGTLAGSYQDVALGNQWKSAHNADKFWSYEHGDPCPSPATTTITVKKQWVVNGNNPVTDSSDDGMIRGKLSVKNVKNADWDQSFEWKNSWWPTVTEGKPSFENGLCYGIWPYYSVSHNNNIVAGQDNIITVTNYVKCDEPPTPTVEINLYKEWVDATGNPVTALTIASGETSDTKDSMWDGTSGSTSAQLDVPQGASVDISEEPSAGYPSNWEPASWACYEVPEASYLRNPAASAFLSEGSEPGALIGSGESATSGNFIVPENYDGDAIDCYFTNTELPPPSTTTTSRPTPVEPSYGAQCTVGDTGDQITVTTPEVINGIRYVVDGQGTASVTITASPADTAHTVTLSADSPWSAMTDGTATITVTSTSPETLTCVASEEQEESAAEEEQPPAEEEQGEPTTKPDTTVEVKGESQEVISGAPSATAKTGESGSAYWTYLTLAAGVLLLLGSARIRRRDNGA